MDIELREHPASTVERPLTLAIVTTKRGRCFYAVYAPSNEGDRPTEERVRKDWADNRNGFEPYLC